MTGQSLTFLKQSLIKKRIKKFQVHLKNYCLSGLIGKIHLHLVNIENKI